MKNKAVNLYNHLFEQLERLNDDKLNGEKLLEECERASAMSNVASQIINMAKVEVQYLDKIGATKSNFLSLDK